MAVGLRLRALVRGTRRVPVRAFGGGARRARKRWIQRIRALRGEPALHWPK